MELLVVISIMTIIAAILFPVFAQARDSARRANCLSNQKQLLLAHQMYTDDYDDMSVPEHDWRVLVVPYVKSSGIFQCRSQSFKMDARDVLFDTASRPDTNESKQLAGYAVSRVHYKNNALPTAGEQEGYPGASYVNPARAIRLVESKQQVSTVSDQDGFVSLWISEGFLPGQRFIRGVTGPEQCGRGGDDNLEDTGGRRHNGGSTYGFMDGHVQWYRPEQIPCSQTECWWSRPGHH